MFRRKPARPRGRLGTLLFYAPILLRLYRQWQRGRKAAPRTPPRRR